MAYSYDNRYPSGRHDSYYNQRPRHHDVYSSSPASPFDASYGSMPAANSYSYHPRYSYPTAPSHGPTYPPRPEFPKRSRWPPFPSVENEADSLAREVRGPAVSDDSSGEARSRGTVDQEPIMLDVEQPKSELNDERRFVLVSGSGMEDAKSAPASRDSRRRSFAERGNMPHLNTDMHEPSIPLRREPSPYMISKPAKENPSRNSAEYFLSPETITPKTSNVPKSIPKSESRDVQGDQNSKPVKPQHRRYDSGTSPRASHLDIFDDSDLENNDSASLGAPRKPARYSFVRGDLQKEDLRTSLNGPGKDPQTSPRTSDPRLPSDHSYSDSSGSSKASTPPPSSPRSSSSTIHNVSAPRPIPQSKNSTLDSPYARSPRKYQDNVSRPSSPLVKDKPWPQSSPRSPTVPQGSGRDLPPQNTPRSRPNSRPSSRAGSPLPFLHTTSMPPPSPKSLDANNVDWNSTYPPVAKSERLDDPRPISRHARQAQSSMAIPPRIDVQSPSPARPLKPATALPYPVDDSPMGTFMPSEEQFKFQPPSTPAPNPISSGAYTRSPMPSSPSINRPRDEGLTARPPPASRHSAADEVPRVSRVRSDSTRSVSAHDVRRVDNTPAPKAPAPKISAPKTPAPLTLEKPLPPCPRATYSSKFDDWYTLENCPNFDVCPSCYQGVFGDTQFAPYFKQTRLYEKRVSRNCDFSSPWVRLAWLLTIKQKRKSLDLIYRLATICEIEEVCPGSREVPGTWYGIKDSYGDHVTKFAICPCDLKQIEVLLPSLRGTFTRIYPASARKAYTCALRTQSRRFPAYLDLLVELDEEATRRDRNPDLRPFLSLAKDNAWKQECSRDNLIVDQTWHFIPRLPELAVCEECFDEVVWPEIKKNNSKIAADFNKTLQFVPTETSTGTSCQLYSPRMRKVWKRAVEDADFGYLAKKAMERKKIEMDLQRQNMAIARLLEEDGRWTGEEREQLKAQAVQLAETWRDWE